jgi:PAS domain S-box-containing protein
MNADLASSVLERGTGMPLAQILVHAFLEHVPDFVYFKDVDSRFIAVSRSLARYFGRESSAEVAGCTDFDFFAEAHARPAYEDEQQIIRTGKPLIGKLEKETWPDGHVTWVLTSKVPLRDEHGTIIGTFGISKDVTESKELEHSLEKTNKELVVASRLAGMAEVATSVLHNVGNVLNSVNVSASVIATGLRELKIDRVSKVGAMMEEHAADIGSFLTTDPAGKKIPEYLGALGRHSEEVRTRVSGEIDSLQKNIDHIKEIVCMQQAYATTTGILEPLNPVDIMEDAARMNSGALLRHEVRLVRDYRTVPQIRTEKSKVLQILVNLIRNAKYACDEAPRSDRIITLRVEPGEPGRVRLIVKDNGVGIAKENMARLFVRGFTTRAEGHGIGLHSSGLAAKDIHATLTAESDGPGTGATFVLDVPVGDDLPSKP